MWFAAMLMTALVALTLHQLVVLIWQKVTTRSVRRHVERALVRGDRVSICRAAAETAEAAHDWPSRELWSLGQAVEIVRHRLAHST